jgi:hypothetical protein
MAPVKLPSPPALGGLHLAPELRRRALALGEPLLLRAQSVGGPLDPPALALLARRGGGELALEAPKLAAGGGDLASLLRRRRASRRRCRRDAERAQGGRRLLALDAAVADSLAELGVGGRGAERLADQLERSVAGRVAGVTGAVAGGVDERRRRLPIPLRGRAPAGRLGIFALQRPALSVLEAAARSDEFLDLAGGGERRPVDQPRGDRRPPEFLDPVGFVAIPGRAQLAGELVPPRDEPVGMLAVELVEAFAVGGDRRERELGEANGGPGPGLRGLDLAILRRRRGHERVEELAGHGGDRVDRADEGLLVGPRGLREAAHLPHVLLGGRADLLLGGGGIEVVELADVSAHTSSVARPECLPRIGAGIGKRTGNWEAVSRGG